MLEGKYADGCLKLAESYRLFPRPGTLFTLADCEAGWGHPATAIRHYDSYLAMLSNMAPLEQQAQREKGREKRAMEQREALAAQVGRITLVLPPDAPKGLLVKLDGAAVDGQDLGAVVTVDPGKHVAAVQVPDGAIAETRFALGIGETKKVLLAIPSSSSPTSGREDLPENVGKKPFWQTSGMWSGVGLATVGLGLGVAFVMAGNAQDREGVEMVEELKLRTRSTDAICDPMLTAQYLWRRNECDAIDALIAKRDAFHTVAAISFGVSAVAAAAAVTLMFLPASPAPSKASLRVLPAISGSSGGALVVGTF
jgi:hypothetical protein